MASSSTTSAAWRIAVFWMLCSQPSCLFIIKCRAACRRKASRFWTRMDPKPSRLPCCCDQHEDINAGR
jgi:cob(I)alamin adenosyltransferase